MRELVHENLVQFIGACTDPPICVILEYCSKGCLSDVLENEDIKLDNIFFMSFIGDIIAVCIHLITI